MDTTHILTALDQEISRLHQARAILAGSTSPSTKSAGFKKRRILSPEARAKIAAAQKARWAKARKAAK